MLTHALQNLPVQFAIRFLIVVGITALLIIIDLHRTKKVLIQNADYNYHEYAIELLPRKFYCIVRIKYVPLAK